MYQYSIFPGTSAERQKGSPKLTKLARNIGGAGTKFFLFWALPLTTYNCFPRVSFSLLETQLNVNSVMEVGIFSLYTDVS